ncbi:uncharacterized protein BO72DRAFT_473222 [Aspergillus fijiensis CBS 313.89]|uniref:Zn(2)-C6 fungal-type domain-containing protein n=1 Tax=Aspergillus fijiensis CBS 313.89 TaxID=1448319 RepID=A0A8G1RFN6_9EURO|nr:uncharacterized protein BO72DRAFT_473222 [Aspergillus fijiensis CBS 313.89]RAK71472.1 hypothetical protein BO72DRAFT_473222 [Aspergillus fijiensis CBS 313.89]
MADATPPARARIACKACNARRVKCDAAIERPCWHCRTRGTPCELIKSRRGRYVRTTPRRSRRLPIDNRDTSDTPDAPLSAESHREAAIDRTLQTTSSSGSSDLTYIIEVNSTPRHGSTHPSKVHYPIPPSIAQALSHSPRAEDPVSLRDALLLPPSPFCRLYAQGQPSPLLLQAIFLLGFTVGDESLVHAAGYSDRVVARRTHYLRAKALYNADYETCSVTTVAALLLLGFYWSGPEDQKDTCYWIGCAIHVAQALGMHRSYVSGVRCLRKRIWWSVYARDRHTAAAFGQPCRIRDEDCDIEPLTQADFDFDDDYDHSLIPKQEDYHVLYVMEMSKLASVLGDILVAEFSPRRPALEKHETDALAHRLAQWESYLPERLRRIPPDYGFGASFWANMLHLSYQNYYILLFRPKAINHLSSADVERDTRACTAADAITRIAEDLLAVGTIQFTQIHFVPALFGALSVHTFNICRKDPICQRLAENKSRQCLLALSELSRSWPVRIWFAKAFLNLLRRLTGQGSRQGGSIVNVSSTIAGHSSLAPSASVDSTEPHTLININPPTASCLPSNAISSELDNTELSHQPGHDHEALLADNQPPSNFSQATEQVLYDTFLAGYIDQTFNSDLLVLNSLGSSLPFFPGGLPETEE